jgi:single-stranded-DNA-specific exonuclease
VYDETRGSDRQHNVRPICAGRRRLIPMARWIRTSADPALVGSLAKELAIPELISRLLILRGITGAQQAARFLRPSLSDLHDPYRMLGMRAAVDRLRRACATGEKILVYGDYDADGTTAVVLLRKAIELAGGTADFYIPHRLRDGYGMRDDVIEHAARQGIRLIVSVDTGIREAVVVEKANGLGIDTIITDHHLPEASPSRAPAALAVLNPNQPGCGYPDKNLSGVGVAFKLAQALLGSLDWPPARLEKVLRSMLRIAAIGTVADVVPLVGENRIIVKFGLHALGRPVNPGLKALLSASGIAEGRPPTAANIAYWLAPRLNAAGRMDTASEVIELFSAADAERGAKIAERLCRLNAERQAAEARIVEEILSEISAAPERAFPEQPPAAIVAAGEGWHRGVLGIVASRLVERFYRPAVVIAISEKEGMAHGSGRSIPPFHLLEALESMAELFARFGGHRSAAGFSLPAARLPEFRSRFLSYAAARLNPEDCIPSIAIDADLNFQEITCELLGELVQLEPHGAGNPEPIFAAAGLELQHPPRVLREKHLRLTLRQANRSFAAMGWRMAGIAASLIEKTVLNAAFTLERDDGGCRLILKDLAWP